MWYRTWILHAFAGLVATFATAADLLAQQTMPTPRLSLAEAIELARENNPDFLVQENGLRSASWRVRSAYGSLLPSVSVSNGLSYTAEGERRLDDVRLATQPATYSSRYSLGVSFSLNGNTLLAPSLARSQARAVREDVAGASATLAAQVTERYLAVREGRDQVAQAERQLNRTAEHVRLAEARFEVGAGTQLDIRRAEVERGRAEVRLVEARNTAANQLLQLGQLLGTRLAEQTELTEAFGLFEPTWEVSALIVTASAENPALRAARVQVEAAGTRVRAARSAYLPSLSISAGISGNISELDVSTSTLVDQELAAQQARYSSCLDQNQIRASAGLSTTNCTAPSDPAALRSAFADRGRFPFDFARQPLGVSLNLSLPIFNGLNREVQVEEARIARANAQHQVRAHELRLEVEVEMAVRNLETAYRSALLQQQVRETAEEELRLAEERFRFGVTTSVEVVDAQASLAEAERAEIAAIYAFHRSLSALEVSVGASLER
jgi:outer membrane protein